MSSSTINLLQKNTGSVREITELEDKLHAASLWSLGILVGAGVLIGASFLYLSTTVRRLETSKIDIGRQINQQSDKEGILLSLKDRTGIAAKALAAGRPWGDLFPLLTNISGSGFTQVSADEAGKVTADLNVGSVEEAADIVTTIQSLAADRSLRSPQLSSFIITESGQIRLSLTFIPIF